MLAKFNKILFWLNVGGFEEDVVLLIVTDKGAHPAEEQTLAVAVQD